MSWPQGRGAYPSLGATALMCFADGQALETVTPGWGEGWPQPWLAPWACERADSDMWTMVSAEAPTLGRLRGSSREDEDPG